MKRNPHPLMVEARRLRKESGLTQMHIAKICGVPFNSINRWEVGKHLPSIASASDYLQSLGYRLKIELIKDGAPK